MTSPTKEETRDFINKNISFFITPLSEKRQKKFQKFYTNADAIDKIADYSQKLMAILYKCTQKLSQDSSTPVIYAWQKGNFEPALEHEEVRQFIMDNKDHPAITIWANKKPTIEMNKSAKQTQKQETPPPTQENAKPVTSEFVSAQQNVVSPSQPVHQYSDKLQEFTKELLKMDKKRFDYLFSGEDTIVRNGKIIMNRRLMREGLTGDLFKSQEDFYQWKNEIISAKNRPSQTIMQEMAEPAQDNTKGLTDVIKKLIDEFKSSLKNLCRSVDGFSSAHEHSSEYKNEGPKQ